MGQVWMSRSVREVCKNLDLVKCSVTREQQERASWPDPLSGFYLGNGLQSEFEFNHL